MAKHNWRIIFRKGVTLHDDTLNRDTNITELVNYLHKFSIVPLGDQTYNEVPSEYYQAWKILVLGTNEFDEHAVSIITSANDNFATAKMIKDRTCKHCGKITERTAWGLCSACGRFQ